MKININFLSIKALLSIIIFFPSFFGYLSLGTGQIMYLAIIFSFLVILYIYSPLKKLDNSVRIILALFFIQITSYTLTLSISVIQGNASLRDYFEICRPFIYCSFFLCPLLINSDITIIPYIRKILIFSTILDIIKFIPIFYPILRFYSPFEFNTVNYIRFSGTFGFCYNYGFIMLFFFLYSIFNKNESQRKKMIYITLLGICILLTGSRSVIAAFFLCIGLFYIFQVSGITRKLKYISFTIILFTALYLILKEIDTPIINATLQYVERLFNTIFGEGSDASLDTRQNQLDLALSYLSQNYLLGIGSMKNVNEPIEMLFGYYLSAWGILGTLIYLSIIIYFLIIARKCFDSPSYYSNFSKANFLWIISIPLIGMSSPITDQVRVFNIFYFIEGLQFLIYTKLQNEKNNSKNS